MSTELGLTEKYAFQKCAKVLPDITGIFKAVF